MPPYEYLCARCGPFTQMRSMAEYDLPAGCPQCASEAPRVILTAPNCSTLSAQARIAHATNERSANAPRRLSTQPHSAGCSCCSGRTNRMVRKGKGGSKSFPNSRPWMICH